ncbi:hypothetical protein SDC9_147806 [bioreactor metagenome]|uniref:Uncharacterized protein n=1 Tax=bioreactor metagenome TaxID=1076179 RepID=A0A645EH09_9ZZZZ
MRVVLQALTDILDHQHIFALIFVVLHQPFAQLPGLIIIRVICYRPGERLGTERGIATSPETFRRRTQERTLRRKSHIKMVAVQVQTAT